MTLPEKHCIVYQYQYYVNNFAHKWIKPNQKRAVTDRIRLPTIICKLLIYCSQRSVSGQRGLSCLLNCLSGQTAGSTSVRQSTGCIGRLSDVDGVISYPTQRETSNAAGFGFRQIAKIRPNPDSRIGYPSVPG